VPTLPLPRPGPGRTGGRRATALQLSAGAFLAAAVVSGALAYDVKIGAALLAAICFVPLALLRLQLAVCTWVVLLFFSRVPGFTAIPDHLLLLIVACWIGLLVGRRAEAREALARNQPVIVTVLLFVVWVAMTLAWAPAPAAANQALKDLFYGTLGFVLLLGTIVERRHVRWLAAAFLLGAALSVLYGAAKGGLGGAIGGPNAVTDLDGRFQAGSGDPNYLAAVLVPAIVLAAALTTRRPAGQRFALGIAAAIGAIGLAATQSRGGLIAAGICTLVALLIWRGRRLLISMLALFAAAMTAVYFLLSPEAWHRIGSGNSSGSGRIDIWHVALRVANDHPWVGVGINQFPQVSPNYVRRPGTLNYVDLIVDKHIVVHNLYLELWAETGLIGLGLFAAVVFVVLRAARRAALRFEAMGDGEMVTLSRATLLAIVGMLAAAFFLSNVGSRQIWVLFAIGPALAGLSQRDAEELAELSGEPRAPAGVASVP
jgi:O-antigen ligase